MDPRRRFFLRGRVATAADPTPRPRPPWAEEDPRFTEVCTRCDACIAACPEDILQRGDGGFPEVTFAQRGCTACGACAAACVPAALQRLPDVPPWSWKPQIADTCLAHRQIECRICGEMCDDQAIRFRPTLGGIARPDLNPDACTGCGACVGPCPTQAILLPASLP